MPVYKKKSTKSYKSKSGTAKYKKSSGSKYKKTTKSSYTRPKKVYTYSLNLKGGKKYVGYTTNIKRDWGNIFQVMVRK